MNRGIERVAGMSVFDPDCTSREVLEHTTGRWGALTLAAPVDGPLRFAEVSHRIARTGHVQLTGLTVPACFPGRG